MSPALAALIAPLKRPRNWILLVRAIIVGIITYGAAAPDDPGPHIHLPPWAWVLFGLLILACNELLERWWPAEAPPPTIGPTRDDPPRAPIERSGR